MIAPELLLSQVESTAPFIFAESFAATSVKPGKRFLAVVRGAKSKNLTPLEYFELCVAAHWSSVACFVPTDVDNAIRLKLWERGRADALGEMLDLVEEAHKWDARDVSARWVRSPKTGEIVGGHHGEWFTIAVAAYLAAKHAESARAKFFADAVFSEVLRERDVMLDLASAGEKLDVLRSYALLAHNYGDLLRVFEMWGESKDEPLQTKVREFLESDQAIQKQAEVYKKFLAAENHRHFALRAVKFLRREQDFLLPLCPFLDDWGAKVAKHPGATPEEIAELVVALLDGYERLPHGTVGYPRALVGILNGFKGGMQRLEMYLPARQSRVFKSGEIRDLCSVQRKRFEEQWMVKA